MGVEIVAIYYALAVFGLICVSLAVREKFNAWKKS